MGLAFGKYPRSGGGQEVLLLSIEGRVLKLSYWLPLGFFFSLGLPISSHYR